MAARRGEQQPAFGARRDHRDDPRLGIDVDHQSQRPAEPATAGQLVGADGEETPVARGDQPLVGRLRMRGEQQLRSEEHTSELQSLMRISYAVFCLETTTKPTTYVQRQTIP